MCQWTWCAANECKVEDTNTAQVQGEYHTITEASLRLWEARD